MRSGPKCPKRLVPALIHPKFVAEQLLSQHPRLPRPGQVEPAAPEHCLESGHHGGFAERSMPPLGRPANSKCAAAGRSRRYRGR